MKTIRKFFVSILLIASLATVSAQDKIGLSLHLGGVLPMGSFTETPSYFNMNPTWLANNNKCGAIFGASLGLRYNYTFPGTRIEDSGVGIFLSADLFWNYINKTTRTKYNEYSCTKPMYINVPVIIGGTWMSDFVNSPVNIWAEAGIGCDLFLKTTEGWSGNTVSYSMNPEFACEGGFGIIISRLVSVGVHYYWLGKQDIKDKETDYSDGFHTAPQVAIHMMAFKVGFHF